MDLTDQQRLYMQKIFDYFHLNGKWPTYGYLEESFLDACPDMEVDEVEKSLPDSFTNGKPVKWQPNLEAYLTVSALFLLPNAKDDLADFVRVLRFCAERYADARQEYLEVSSDEISHQLNMSDLSIRRAGLLLCGEHDFHNFFHKLINGWKCNLTRGVRRFRSVETIEQYLEKRDQPRKLSQETSISPAPQQNVTHEESAIPKSMKPMVFEELIYELLEALDFSEITRPEGKERGFDFKAVYPSKSPTGEVTQQIWIIEVKYYANSRIGRADLDQLLRYMSVSQADKALLITNTNLSSFAKEVVARTNAEARQTLEVWDGERLLALIAQFPKLQNEFGTLLSQFFHESTILLEPKQVSLTERLAKCQPGLKDARLYEEICTEILTEVLVPPLKPPRVQPRTLNGLERRDALFSLRGAKQGWEEIREEFAANFLLCEFKNYTDLFDKDEVNQTRNYLRETIGHIGIIFSRKGASDSAKRMRNSIYAQERKVILFFEDKHLVELLKMKEAGRNPLDLIQDAIEDFFISYE
jgi:hypothetical protein